MNKKYIGAIDAGTTSVRFMIFNHFGKTVAMVQKEHKQYYPQKGWVEHDPLEIWQNTSSLILEGLALAGISAQELAAIGVTNQRETIVMWDKQTGDPLVKAIVWQDTRTRGLCQRLEEEGLAQLILQKTGLPISTYFSGPKIRWLFETNPALKKKATNGEVLLGTIDSWLVWHLTGGAHVTDPSNASRTMLMNLSTLKWDQELLEIFSVPEECLPQIRPSSDLKFYGLSVALGPLGAEIPICGILGDQQAALVGQGCFGLGDSKNTYGTGCFLLMNTGEQIIRSESGLLTTVAYQFGDKKPYYALEGSVAYAGALIQWLRDGLGILRQASDSEALALQVRDNGGVVIVPAFSGLFAPYWRNDARGVICGLTSYVTKHHIARGALESICLQTYDVIKAMEKDVGIPLNSLQVDGGATTNQLLLQIQADVLGINILKPQMIETTALGAAFAAGLASGFWDSTDEIKKLISIDAIYKPQISSAVRDGLISKWNEAVQRSLHWV